MAAYSMDLRKRVLADCDAGLKTKPVAEKYGVSRTWVRWLKQRRRETGNIAPGHSPGRPRKIDRAKLQQLVADDPDATLVELRDRLGVDCAPTAIWMALAALKITFKKKRCGPLSKTAPTSRSAARPGGSSNSGSTPSGSSSSMKPGRPRT
jgi:transposase